MELLTIHELAEKLKAKISWVYTHHASGRIPAKLYIGRSPRFDLEQVTVALSRRRSLKTEKKVSSLTRRPGPKGKERDELWL